MLQWDFEWDVAIKHAPCDGFDKLDEMQGVLVYGLPTA